MIDYPEDERLREQAKQHDLQVPLSRAMRAV
jgi:hypothetical protein